MEHLRDRTAAEERVRNDVEAFLRDLRQLTTPVDGLTQGIGRLRLIRSTVYENLNQIQHEYLVLKSLEWLRADGTSDARIEWSWNPRQTGDSSEPDLRATLGNQVVISAEVTTSERPIGVIDTRMGLTLEKLGRMPGRRLYFVRSVAMERRAKTKVTRSNLPIEVVNLEPTAV